MIHGVMDFINLPRPPVSSQLSTHAPTCTYTHTNTYMYQRIPTYTCTNMYIYTYQDIHVHAHQHIHVHVPVTYTCTNIYQQAHVPSYTYKHTNTTHINPAIHAPSSFVHIWYSNAATTFILAKAVTAFETNLYSRQFHHYIHTP